MSEEIRSATDTLTQILLDMNSDGGFLTAVLTDSNGLPIVFAAQGGFDPERQSATVAMIKKTINLNGRRMGIAQAEEISIVDNDGHLLICRTFSAGSHELILAVLINNRQQPYRRITTRAISEISRVWTQHWK
jgi:predicted regulator of Ras-like GTPase activity (Roadblock/LC7/MglB family)